MGRYDLPLSVWEMTVMQDPCYGKMNFALSIMGEECKSRIPELQNSCQTADSRPAAHVKARQHLLPWWLLIFCFAKHIRMSVLIALAKTINSKSWRFAAWAFLLPNSFWRCRFVSLCMWFPCQTINIWKKKTLTHHYVRHARTDM